MAEAELFTADYAGAIVCPSPNFGGRRGSSDKRGLNDKCGGSGAAEDGISMLILHYTGMPTAAAALAHLTDPKPADGTPVSAHYLLYENGDVAQLVPEAQRAWHAGCSFWQGEEDINSRSIGIEIVQTGIIRTADGSESQPLYPPQQIEALIKLCRSICARHNIAQRLVLGHSDIAPERKIDPGQAFSWADLAAAGLGHYVPPAPIIAGLSYSRGMSGQPIAALQSMLALYGYRIAVNGDYDAQTELVVAAFQRHFRPAQVDGIADISTLETLRALLLSLPQAAV